METEAKAQGIDTQTFTEKVKFLRSPKKLGTWPKKRPRLHPESRLPLQWKRDEEIGIAACISAFKARLTISQTTEEETYTPLLGPESLHLIEDSPSDVIEVVLNEFPTPNESVPYEEILGFKADPSVQRDFDLFRRWMRKKVRDENTSLLEVREEISDLLSDYREHMGSRENEISSRSDAEYSNGAIGNS